MKRQMMVGGDDDEDVQIQKIPFVLEMLEQEQESLTKSDAIC